MPADAPLRAAGKPKARKRKTYNLKPPRSDAAQRTAPIPKPPRSDASQRTGAKTGRSLPRSDAAQRTGARTPPTPRQKVNAELNTLRKHYIHHDHTPSLGDVLHVLESPLKGHGGKNAPHGSTLGAALYHPSDAGHKFVQDIAATGVATLHDPIGVPVKTAKGGVEILKSIPSGIVNTALHPGATLKAAEKDYSRRYGQSFHDMVKRIRKEGAAPDVADALTVGTLGGATVGRAVMAGLRKSGSEFATAARPALRVSGGIIHEQELAPTLGKALAQRGHDRARAWKVKRATKDLKARKPVDAVRVLAADNGEVVRLRPVKYDRTLAKSVAKDKSHTVHRQKTEIVRHVNAARKVLSRLNKHEKQAYHYISTGQFPADRAGFEAARNARLDAIHAARAEGRGEPLGLLHHTDEAVHLPEINLDKVDFGKVQAAHRSILSDAIKVGREDPSLNVEQRLLRRYDQQAKTLGIHRGDTPGSVTPSGIPALHGDESVANYVGRVAREAKAKGLETPAYFPSERYSLDLNPDFSAYTSGGARAAATSNPYRGENFRLGLQDTSPEAFLTGMARNIRRKFNWKLVADLKDKHAIGGLEGSAQLVRAAMYEKGIDPKSYVLWNPKIWRGEATKAMHELDGTPEAHAFESNALAPEQRAADALRQSTDVERYAHEGGWVAIPKGAWKEIEDSTKPSGAIGRGWDIFKGKNSRLLLGAGNIPWLQFQVASNAMISGFATKGALIHQIPQAVKWWRGLDQEAKDEANALLGAGVTHDTQQVRLGAAADNLVPGVKQIVGGWKAIKDLPVWHHKVAGRLALSDLNPIEAMFRADHAQTSAFKRAVLYNEVKKETFRRMGEHMTVAQQLQSRVAHALTRPPEEALRAVTSDPQAIVRHAETVNDWMGDFTTYTARERKVLSRGVMFYGFLRYSLKFVFYTMPFKHPVQTAIVGKLGQLEREEIKNLLGGEGLPWSFGKLYLTKDGKLQEVNLARANPALNTLTDVASGHPSSWVSIAPPIAVSIAEQMPGIGGRRFYFDRPWMVEGHGYGEKHYTAAQHLRIFTEQLFDLAAPYRVAEKATMHGAQGDDSMLFAQHPLVNNGKREIDRAKRSKYKFDQAFDDKHSNFLNEVVPLLPRPSRDALDQPYQKRIDKLNNQLHDGKKKPRKSSGGGGYKFGGGSGGGYKFGSGG